MPKHEKKPDPTTETPAYLRRSRRMRRILVVVIILLVILLAACVYLSWQLVRASEQTAYQQTQDSSIEEEDAVGDASTSTVKTTTVPNLLSLLGMTSDEAVEEIQHGAQITGTQDVNEEGNPVKSEVTVALTSEQADSRSGTPSVYLSLDEAGKVVKVGYSTSTSSLGYGSLSFTDAVVNETIIEKTFSEAGIDLPDDAVVLPDDKAEYSSYDSDGTTLTKESYTFSGSIDVDDKPCTWEALLLYDYMTANATGNLSDTVRTLSIYVSTV